MSRAQEEEDDYNSSSDEDYDPTKDTDNDKHEIDDEEEGEEEEELVEQPKKSVESTPAPVKPVVDIDAIFAELTGMAPPASTSSSSSSTSSGSSKPEEKCYPKAVVSSAEPSKVYPKKPQTATTTPVETATKPAGIKRIGLLDATKALTKRSKMSVLDRSDQDWKEFTAQNNLKEDLESHNRGKGGYLNKMEFLSRTDNRQFEVERAFRATARKDN